MTSQVGTLIQTEDLAEWRKNSKARCYSWLIDTLAFRDKYVIPAHDEGELVVAQMYIEAADAFGIPEKTLRNKLSILREYSKDKLIYWMVDKRVPLQMIDLVNKACNDGTIKDTPADYLDKLVMTGNADGKTPTVQEVSILIAEESGKGKEYHQNVLIGWVMRKFGIDSADFQRELRELVKRYTL